MTLIGLRIKRCALCSRRSIHRELLSTSSFGTPDLDGRPAGMARGTLSYWVKSCPYCGYCVSDIADTPPLHADTVVAAPTYRALRRDRTYPLLARHFLCAGLIQEEAENIQVATQAAIHAAWACDDSNQREAAVRCRRLAIARLQQIHRQGRQLMSNKPAGTDMVLLADLLRRSGDFETAIAVCQVELQPSFPPSTAAALQYEHELAAQGNADCHNIEHQSMPKTSTWEVVKDVLQASVLLGGWFGMFYLAIGLVVLLLTRNPTPIHLRALLLLAIYASSMPLTWPLALAGSFIHRRLGLAGRVITILWCGVSLLLCVGIGRELGQLILGPGGGRLGMLMGLFACFPLAGIGGWSTPDRWDNR